MKETEQLMVEFDVNLSVGVREADLKILTNDLCHAVLDGKMTINGKSDEAALADINIARMKDFIQFYYATKLSGQPFVHASTDTDRQSLVAEVWRRIREEAVANAEIQSK